MKSLHKPQPRFSREQLEAWSPSDLNLGSRSPADDLQEEQILAIFQGDGTSVVRRQKSTRSALHPSESDPAVTTWQVGDMELLPPPKNIKEWSFLESFDELEEREEDLPEAIDPRHEAQEQVEAILKQARAQAEEILLEAQGTADRILSETQAQTEQRQKEGYELGWSNARVEIGESVKAAHTVVQEIRAWQAQFMSEAEQTLVTMLKEMAQAMFGEGVALDANALQINLNRIMENAQRLGDMNIFLNPRDAALLDSSWSEYQFQITGNRVRIIPSEKITPGGCIVKGSMGMVDARVEPQLAAMLSTIDELSEAKD